MVNGCLKDAPVIPEPILIPGPMTSTVWFQRIVRASLWAVGNIAFCVSILFTAFVILPWIDKQNKFQETHQEWLKEREEGQKKWLAEREDIQNRQLVNEAAILSGQRLNLKLASQIKAVLEEADE